ncbi:L,D-transpeptidase [Phreatobacter sp.]|uniref:L,D-transpeptidase n=1 Tax=Phreatobacter sp. TaxID=1966341 RepID=UPI0022CB820F|nr:L,D-transpeptidase [Phreatobacter sp.]MCZ8314124.1 L,D-transpeptidase [Phreatobacter sp.]
MAIFFRGGYAIHGTNMVGRLGQVDSHGCIRLAPGNARTLFEMVARQRGSTRIVIEGASPRQAPPAAVASRATRSAAAAPRTAQMRLAQPASRQVAVRTAVPRTVQGGAIPSAQRVAARPASRVMAPAGASDSRYFTEWFLRR